MKNSKQIKTELLAPAGSMESFFAAVESGADAVFCGLTHYSARAKAKNFTLQEFERLQGYARERGVKVYVALNTLIKEHELAPLVELLAELEYLLVDGLIIQDLGLYHIASNYFPEIPLHASTQMLTHNVAGVLMLEQMGFRRVVLARELTLQEIAEIHEQSSLELEHFVHGALCYSMSGHCLFSSYMDGRSGNRGRCIQPCRRRYHHDGEPGFYYSTSDFSAIDMIPELINAGVRSFKIEGRMKSAEYVATVVSSYRMVIDAGLGQEKEVLQAAREKLANAMGRTGSHGFLKGADNADIVLEKQKGGIGKIIGRVERIQGRSIAFRGSDVIHVGDRLRIQPEDDRAGRGFTVRTLKIHKRTVKRAAIGSFVSISLPFKTKVTVGDLVFKLSTGKTFTLSEEACRRRLGNAPLRAHSLHLTVECGEGTVRLVASLAGMNVEKRYSVEMFAAKRSPLSEATLLKVFSSTGNPVLSLGALRADDLPPVVIKPSRLKEIRRDFYHFLFAEFQGEQQRQREERLEKIAGEIRNSVESSGREGGSTLFVVSDQLQDLQAMAEYPDIQFILPLNSQFVAELTRNVQGSRHLLQGVIWDVPSIVFDHDWPVLTEMVERLRQAGFDTFRLNNPAHFQLFDTASGVNLIAGPWLYSLNSQAMEATAGLGVQKWSLSVEDERGNVQRLLAGKGPDNLLLTVYSPVDLFTSRIRPVLPERNFTLKSDTGESLFVVQQNGLTVTRPEKPFSLLGRLQSLAACGCLNFVLDLRGIGFLSAEGQHVLRAFYEDSPLPGTTTFNFERKLL